MNTGEGRPPPDAWEWARLWSAYWDLKRRYERLQEQIVNYERVAKDKGLPLLRKEAKD